MCAMAQSVPEHQGSAELPRIPRTRTSPKRSSPKFALERVAKIGHSADEASINGYLAYPCLVQSSRSVAGHEDGHQDGPRTRDMDAAGSGSWRSRPVRRQPHPGGSGGLGRGPGDLRWGPSSYLRPCGAPGTSTRASQSTRPLAHLNKFTLTYTRRSPRSNVKVLAR